MTSARNIKDKLYEQFARIGQAMSSAKRLELLELLCQCEKAVETLAADSSMSIANTSRHLQVLRGAGLVETRRDGVHIFYRIADEGVCELFGNMRSLAESRLAEVDRILTDLNRNVDELEPMDRNKLMKLAKSGKVTILDVRPADEFTAEHLPHAISVPLSTLKSLISKLPRDQQIVAYCRGPYCVLATEAVEILRKKGFQAGRLSDGIREWREAGMPTNIREPL